MVPPEPTVAGTPLRIGRYEVLSHLATGGMAQIYLARTTGLGSFERHVVLKTILRERAQDQRFVDMFLDEAKLAATLNHQNVAQVYEVDQADGAFFMAMEYVHGENARAILETSLRRGWTVPLELAVMIVGGAAAGLHHAHERKGKNGAPLNIVHRDVSPANVMVGFDGSVKVLDFGIAKAEERATKTVGGTIKGKYGYMSPEQCKGKPIDRRSDIFALGICLYELTTLRRAFKGNDDFETMKRIVSGDVLLPSAVVPGYPRELEAIVLTAMANDPGARFQTAAEMIEALDAFAVRAKLTGSNTAMGRFMVQLFGSKKEPWVDGGEGQQSSDQTMADGAAMAADGAQPIGSSDGRGMLDLRFDDDDEKTSIVEAKDMGALHLEPLPAPKPPPLSLPKPLAPPLVARTPTRPSQPPMPALSRTMTPPPPPGQLPSPPQRPSVPRPLPTSAAHAAAKASASEAADAAAWTAPDAPRASRPSGRMAAARPTAPPFPSVGAPTQTVAGLPQANLPRRPSRPSVQMPMQTPPQGPLDLTLGEPAAVDLQMEPLYPEPARGAIDPLDLMTLPPPRPMGTTLPPPPMQPAEPRDQPLDLHVQPAPQMDVMAPHEMQQHLQQQHDLQMQPLDLHMQPMPEHAVDLAEGNPLDLQMQGTPLDLQMQPVPQPWPAPQHGQPLDLQMQPVPQSWPPPQGQPFDLQMQPHPGPHDLPPPPPPWGQPHELQMQPPQEMQWQQPPPDMQWQPPSPHDLQMQPPYNQPPPHLRNPSAGPAIEFNDEFSHFGARPLIDDQLGWNAPPPQPIQSGAPMPEGGGTASRLPTDVAGQDYKITSNKKYVLIGAGVIGAMILLLVIWRLVA